MASNAADWKLRVKVEAGEADTAAQALKRLGEAIKSDQKEIGQMRQAMRALKGAVEPDTVAIADLKKAIDVKRNAVAASGKKLLELGGAHETVGKKTRAVTKDKKGLRSELEALLKRVQSMPGPIGVFAGGLLKLKQAATGSKLFLIAMAAALTALVVATVKATRALYTYATAQADARRSELLRLEGMTKLRFLYPRVAGNAVEMQGALDRVAAKVPAARGELAKYGETLYRMGLRGAAWEKSLEGVGIKLATQGAEFADAFANRAAGANMTGGLDRIVARVRKELGPIAARQMLSLTVQTEKQKEAFDALFSSLKMDSYLGAWKEVNDLLSQSTASGRSLKQILTGVLQPMIDASAKFAPLVKRFFQGMILAALDLAIAVVVVRNKFKDWFGDSEILSKLDLTTVALGLGYAAVWLLGIGLSVAAVAAYKLAAWGLAKLTPALTRAAIAGWGAVAPWLPFILAAAGVAIAIVTLIKYWDELKLAFSQLDWSDVGRDIVDGLIRGLEAMPIVGPMVTLGKVAIAAFKGAIGSASPAKAFIRVGAEIPRGVALGVEQTSPVARAAAGAMVGDVAAATVPRPAAAPVAPAPQPAPPSLGRVPAADAGARDGAKPAAARGGAQTTISFAGGIHVHTDADKPEGIALDIRRELERVLEGLLVETGGTPA